MTFPFSFVRRRSVLKGLLGASALLGTTALQAVPVLAQSRRFAFSFEDLVARMRERAAVEYLPEAVTLPEGLLGLDYDAYRMIQFRPERTRWTDLASGYRLQAFHLGWLFPEPVRLFEITGGEAVAMSFGTEDFNYFDPAIGERIEDPLPGVAGLRISYPMAGPDELNEVVSFLGASYFRALGRDNIYGLSARGVAIDTWRDGAEEFPRFSEFYLERPTEAGPLVINAALESPSLTGAYRFAISPGTPERQETVMEVTAHLFIRNDIDELGIAPLTSMFLFADANRGQFDDYRPRVHDSNGLLVERQSGEILWRALNNDDAVGNTYLGEFNPSAFGLYQRGRDFDDYQDGNAHYEWRPSARIEPVGEWGEGMVRLIEIPALVEADDNVVAFWVPSQPARAGDEREFSYRLIWGDLDVPSDAPLAPVVATRAGQGGVAGIEAEEGLRKFVVDFDGAALASLPPRTAIDVYASAANGVVRNAILSTLPDGNRRVVIDVEVLSDAPLELKAYLIGGGRQLTETWLYQWRAPAS